MATTAVDRVFVDTNVLVYSSVLSAPLHTEAFQKVQDLRKAGVELWISRQILREYLATLSRPQTFTAPLSPTVLAADMATFQATLHIAEDGPTVTSNLITLLLAVPMGGKQIHDANIVATMQ